MYSFIKDLKFCEEMTEYGFNGGITLVLVKDRLFHEGSNIGGIYQYFRNNIVIKGDIKKPTGNTNDRISINCDYRVNWVSIGGESCYYMIPVSQYKTMSEVSLNSINSEVKTQNNNVRIKSRRTNNPSISEVCSYIESVLNEAKSNGIKSVTMISGELHKEMDMKNAMPTVCNALRKVATKYPKTVISKPETVKGLNSSTIKVKFQW
jgi:hypothetical protein